MSHPVVRLSELALSFSSRGERFASHKGSVVKGSGMKHLGCTMTVVPPGKRAWPYHCHHANDELFVVLEGTGTLRYGEEEHSFQAGDVLVCPVGGPETAHQLINTGEVDLRFLSISSMREPDVMEYPDSGKWGALAGTAPGGGEEGRTFEHWFRDDATRPYWSGEE